jgi:superfamily II DNA or RNA helicase
MIRALRPHQEAAIAMLRRSLGSGKRRPMLQAPTGFGKTLTAAAIIDGARAKGKRVIFCVPALSLINQTVEEFEREGITEIGVIQAVHERTDWRQPVQIASVQTLQRRPKIPGADLVLIDEAHKWFQFYARWMADPAFAQVPFIGLSATPWTKGLGRHFDDLIVAATTRDLIAQHYLSPFRVYAPSHPDLSAVRTKAGDYHEGDLAQAMDKPALIADVVETWLRRGEGRSTLCFAVDRAHAKNLQLQFTRAGIATAYIDAHTGEDEREAIKQQFHAGDIRIVCNVGCLTTGVDWDVRCIVLARPTQSEILYSQIVGRGLRLGEGKDDCLILDHSDTTLRLGFVTDIHHDALDDGKAGTPKARLRKQALPKECPSCAFLKPAKVPKCPACGFLPERQSTIACEAGELIELKGKSRLKAESKARLYGQLKLYARRRSYQPGWASRQFRTLTGAWPDHVRTAPEIEPTPELLSWLTSQRIRRAKRRDPKTIGHAIRHTREASRAHAS